MVHPSNWTTEGNFWVYRPCYDLNTEPSYFASNGRVDQWTVRLMEGSGRRTMTLTKVANILPTTKTNTCILYFLVTYTSVSDSPTDNSDRKTKETILT